MAAKVHPALVRLRRVIANWPETDERGYRSVAPKRAIAKLDA